MAFYRVDGRDLEIPRHVHRRDGTSKIVSDVAELRTAEAEGWLVDPNAPEVPSSVWLYGSEDVAFVDAAQETTQEAQASEPVESPVVEPEAPSEPVDAPDAPPKRGPGRPRKAG